jgi:hypothetical protein
MIEWLFLLVRRVLTGCMFSGSEQHLKNIENDDATFHFREIKKKSQTTIPSNYQVFYSLCSDIIK